MNYKKVLEYLGFIEGVDFELTEIGFNMLPKTREAIEVIHHDEVLEVLDNNGNVITPYTPAFNENIPYQEVYTPDSPTEETLQDAQNNILVNESDIALLLEKYLKDKSEFRDQENDSINIVENRIHSWTFANIPQPTIAELAILAPIVKLKKEETSRKDSLLHKGKKARQACLDCLDLIAGFNLDRALTATQITEMQNTFAQVQMALMTSRPSSAKALISSIAVDDILLTEQMKSDVLGILAEY